MAKHKPTQWGWPVPNARNPRVSHPVRDIGAFYGYLDDGERLIAKDLARNAGFMPRPYLLTNIEYLSQCAETNQKEQDANRA